MIFSSIATVTCSVQSQRFGNPRISKKALHKQGPVPTDHGISRLQKMQNQHIVCAGDRTAEPGWPAVGAGLHLLSLA